MAPDQNPRRNMELLTSLIREGDKVSVDAINDGQSGREFSAWFKLPFNEVCCRYAGTIAKHQIEKDDLFQETFRRVFEKMRNCPWRLIDPDWQDGRLYKYISKTAENRIIDLWRQAKFKQRYQRRVEIDSLPSNEVEIAERMRDASDEELEWCQKHMPRFVNSLKGTLAETAFAIMHSLTNLEFADESRYYALYRVLQWPSGRHLPQELIDEVNEFFPEVTREAVSQRIGNLKRAFAGYISTLPNNSVDD
jgi:DNA-directed RNA polymerase specialized sigma24 family protein